MSDQLVATDDVTVKEPQSIEIDCDTLKLVHKGRRGGREFSLMINGHDLTNMGGIQNITIDIGVDAVPTLSMTVLELPPDKQQILDNLTKQDDNVLYDLNKMFTKEERLEMLQEVKKRAQP